MDTDELIRALSVDAGRRRQDSSVVWRGAVALALLLAAIAFFSFAGARVDIAQAAETVRFNFKFVVSTVLAVSALYVLNGLLRPGDEAHGRWIWLAPVVLSLAVTMELLLAPPGEWTDRMIGSNGVVCFTLITLIGVGPLAVLIAVLRYGAPTRPGLAGSFAGLAAGGIAALFYALHCTDDSPLFVAVWYPLAVAMLSALGCISSRLFVRW